MENFLDLNWLESNYEKTLLLTAIHNYKDKIRFILKNKDLLMLDSFVVNDFKKDLKYLKDLELRIFSIEI